MSSPYSISIFNCLSSFRRLPCSSVCHTAKASVRFVTTPPPVARCRLAKTPLFFVNSLLLSLQVLSCPPALQERLNWADSQGTPTSLERPATLALPQGATSSGWNSLRFYPSPAFETPRLFLQRGPHCIITVDNVGEWEEEKRHKTWKRRFGAHCCIMYNTRGSCVYCNKCHPRRMVVPVCF